MARTNLFHQLKKRQQRRNKRAADAQRLSLENLEERLAMTANSAGLDDAALDAFLASPAAAVPGTSMAFEGIQDAALRQTIIDYLKALQ